VINPKIKSKKILIHRYFAAIVSIFMLSQSFVATASITGVIAQQVPNKSPEYVKGKQLLDEADKLVQQGTGESPQKAIALYEQALLKERKIGDRDSEATTLLSIGTL
jgi:hypothetical protein